MTTQTEHDALAVVRLGFDAFAAGDLVALSELFEKDANWRAAPAGVLPGDCIGRDAILAMFAQLGSETHGEFHVTPHTFAASGNQVFVSTTDYGKRNGKTLEGDQVLVFTVVDGKVREVKFYEHDHPATAAFWS
jgi:hypothetical protein